MNHVLKYVHGVDTLDDTVPTKGTYWAQRTTNLMVKVVKFEEASQDLFAQSNVHLEIVHSGVSFTLTLAELKADFTRISTPPSEKPFAWLRKFFVKRQILSLRDIQRIPQHKLQNLYVMNGLTVESFLRHRTFTKIPFPVPKLTISMHEKSGGKSRATTLSVWESWAPVDLLEQYDPSTILDSKEFRDAVAAGSLYILSVKYAKHLLAQQETQAEIQRMKEVKEFVERMGTPRTLTAGTEPTNKIAPLPPHYKDLEVNNNASGGVSILSKNAEIRGDYGDNLF